jgi:PAS domain S-box-containing protein
VRLDGEERLIEAIAFAVPGGGSIQVHVIARDITKQAAAERRLAEQGAQLRLLFDRSTAGIVSWSPEGRILAANQAFGRFTGYTIAELTGGMHMRDLRKTDEDDGEEAFRRLADGRIDDITLDRSFRHRDGRTVWGRMSAARISAASEEAGPAFMGVLCDVTETHDALDRLQTLNDELERRVDERTAELRASLRELDSFSHAVTHDLRAPLRSVSGYSEFVLQDYGGALPDDARQMLRRVVDSGRDMSRMIEALFNLSRLGRAELRRTKVDLSALARVVSREIRDAEPNRTITFTIAEDLQVEADPMLMRSVLQNLLGNAAKYTRDVAEPQVEFGRVAGNTREFFVRDNGAGFDMSQAKLLFAPFRRLHSAGEFEGTGIGLATVKKIIERHGGRVRASAVPRGGATFFFRL